MDVSSSWMASQYLPRQRKSWAAFSDSSGDAIGAGFATTSAGVGAGSVFDAFRRGNGALAAGIPGTGLGLAIVREVVEQAAGRIHVHSRPGEGTRFTILFPARQVETAGPVVRDTRASEIVVEETQPVE